VVSGTLIADLPSFQASIRVVDGLYGEGKGGRVAPKKERI
jgi:hypothetical protein